MSKELEALKIVRSGGIGYTYDEYSKAVDIVENALKENERLKCSYLENLLNEESKDYISKKLKALEIIKTKNVFVWGFVHRQEEIKDFEWTYEYYRTHYGYFHSGHHFDLLTRDEFYLLKEVLL